MRSSALRRHRAEQASHAGSSIVPLKLAPQRTGHLARFPATPALPAGRSCGSERGHQGYRMRVRTRPVIPAQALARANSIAERCHEHVAACLTKQHGPIDRFRPPAERGSCRRRFRYGGKDRPQVKKCSLQIAHGSRAWHGLATRRLASLPPPNSFDDQTDALSRGYRAGQTRAAWRHT